MKKRYKYKYNSSFRPTTAEKTDTIIKYFPVNNAAGSDILVNLL